MQLERRSEYFIHQQLFIIQIIIHLRLFLYVRIILDDSSGWTRARIIPVVSRCGEGRGGIEENSESFRNTWPPAKNKYRSSRPSGLERPMLSVAGKGKVVLRYRMRVICWTENGPPFFFSFNRLRPLSLHHPPPRNKFFSLLSWEFVPKIPNNLKYYFF